LGVGFGIVGIWFLDKKLFGFNLFPVGSNGGGIDLQTKAWREIVRMGLAETVYLKLREVPRGKVTTYKWLAESVGSKGYQAVGQVLKRNPDAPRTPCHRVVSSSGKIGGFGGERVGKKVDEKIRMLRQEGVGVRKGRIDLEQYGFDFKR